MRRYFLARACGHSPATKTPFRVYVREPSDMRVSLYLIGVEAVKVAAPISGTSCSTIDLLRPSKGGLNSATLALPPR